MTWNYAYTPAIWPSVCTVLLLIVLADYSGRRRSVPGATPFMIACLLSAAWAVGGLLEIAAVDAATKVFWFKFQAVVQLPILIAITCFILEYTWPGRWLTHRNLVLLNLPFLLGMVLILTDHMTHLVWHRFSINGSIIPQWGPGGWLMAVYFIAGLAVLDLLIFGWLFINSPQHRWPVVIMLVGQFVGRALFTLERVYTIRSVPPLALFGMMIEFTMYAIALFGFRIFDPITLARQAVITQMYDGMLVLDPAGRVASLNPAAAAILESPQKRLLGRSIEEILPLFNNLAVDLPQAGADQVELSLAAGSGTRSYQLEVSSLRDWRGLEAGRLLLLHDVTAQKQAQAQLLEQERALAMLHEREQLARELHDSTGQVLGFTSLKLGVVRKLIADGKLVKADDQLARLESMVAEAHADMREYILNLRTAPTGEKPFFSALGHYLDGFRQNYGIQVDYSIGEGVDEKLFSPEMQMQLFRIVQEAFSNARKHAETNRVQLSFERNDSLVRVCIQDNGIGFDPQQAATARDGHYGLRFMRERAEKLGGNLQVGSAPGTGTRVLVEVPVDHNQWTVHSSLPTDY
jgi:signal transduction histidine kinase